MLEIHGMRDCPFSWRARICAREKGVAFDWIPYDLEPRNPLADAHNPERRSPKLIDGAFELTESLVILQYLDEGYHHVSLQALGARERAQMRLRFRLLAKLEAHPTAEHPPDEERLEEGFASLEQSLQGGRAWLGGAQPDLSDVAVWPFLWLLEKAGYDDRGPRTAAYWTRAKKRESLLATRPT